MIYDQSLDTPMPRCEYWLMASDTVHGNVWLRKFTYNEFAEQFWVTAYAVNSTTSVADSREFKSLEDLRAEWDRLVAAYGRYTNWRIELLPPDKLYGLIEKFDRGMRTARRQAWTGK